MARDPGDRPTTPASLDREFRIAFGQTIAVESTDLEITFDDVSDSRCPQNAVCVWEGTAHVVLAVATSTTKPALLALDTHPDLPGSGRAFDYVIRLVKVDPFPILDVAQPRESYVVTLVVSS
jgi:hypothetical protein